MVESIQKKNRKQFFIVLPGLVSVVFLILSLIGCSGKVVKVALQENIRLQAENEKLTHEIVILRARIEDLIRSQPGLTPEESEYFKKKGLDDPVEDIVNDLGSREDLMPFKGIFGARPSFYKDVRMYVLNSRWVYTTWNSGSAIGQQLFEYTVSDDGKIFWKKIETHLLK
jgi:hypothetical protein